VYKKNFFYHLPNELIAQIPSHPRDECKLMVLHKDSKKIEHRIFKEVINYLKKEDVLVMNNTKVFPLRFSLYRKTGMKLDAVLVKKKEGWKILAKKVKKLRDGELLLNEEKKEILKVKRKNHEVFVEFLIPFDEAIKKYGKAPLPPYIKREPAEKDKENYQTVYAKKGISAAAPTAGLHFTEKLLKDIEKKGTKIAYITLNIGEPTFRPIQKEVIEEYRMGEEKYEIPEDAFQKIKKAKRVIAVGTSVVRALEDCYSKYREILPVKESARIFIYPGFKFNIVQGLLTNFHQPESPPLILVASFVGKDFLFDAYKEAVRKRYKFLSYGDAMLIL